MARALALSVALLLGCSGPVDASSTSDGPDEAQMSDAPSAESSGDAIVDTSASEGAVGDLGGEGSSRDGGSGDATVRCTANGVEGECMMISDCRAPFAPVPGHCAGPASVECCVLHLADADPFADADAMSWCPTDPEASPNAGLVEAAGDRGCPSGMIKITTFCIDKYEAEIVIANADGTTTPWSPFYPPPSDRTYRAVSLKGAVPQGYISGQESAQACAASGKRLCNNAEWLRACQGPTGTTYPYGNTREPGVCNDHRAVHPAVECFSSSASWVFSDIDWPGINQQANTVDRTGSRTGCVTAEGAFDMMGNLHEWIDGDPGVDRKPIAAIDFRGGFYTDTVLNGPGCLYQTTAHSFTHWDYSTGFRCCADAK